MLNEIEVGLICLSERKKFKEVYEEYFTALKYFAMRYVKDEEVACDLLQDIFVKLWEKGDRFENEMQLKTYLYRVVRNHCLTYVRDTQRKEKRMEGFEVEETEESFVHQMIEAEIYALINDIFEELPDACRNVYMKSLEGKSHKEIAEELHIAITTIKKHKTNANNYLRERLKGLLCFMMYLGI
ncbi:MULTISPECIES: RNA polymerase sigma-70 factor [Butyricimonas]|jgi:RNA polymerase sigma-70 factor|uniref:RNA polymerase sigma-70 factor (ECF subfamily) n=1 Tax=Butyricimonas faecihominis TaxID=1472416 RepID=A0A7W6HXG6_9BACT|nr:MULTISPECIES: RNA polymerase sigma-70 factor [Butyricimonas]MBS6689002.1 RNA polymerase sigma-70 factor [Sanguibacteroides justesenii]OKZ20557.1 MAG: hypothetical protein BHV81_01660 [Butyricimonas synergistica]KAB1507214.1 RNA polymerase sigma-70 factor [Butyricimonas faecihominis]MBB4026742.1 RNA polymerase sigma-70 factor (ECF subfamily) [Butyricimonas faecihominis]WOF09952.1 RNA polymerase sigma-70 factor [Butyricimonas faecihominis]